MEKNEKISTKIKCIASNNIQLEKTKLELLRLVKIGRELEENITNNENESNTYLKNYNQKGHIC